MRTRCLSQWVILARFTSAQIGDVQNWTSCQVWKDARKCKSWPYSGYCKGWSPFIQNSPEYNSLLSSQGWEDVGGCTAAEANGAADTFIPGVKGPVFASNGKMLVNDAGVCQTGADTSDGNPSGATNPGDYFKPSPAVEECQQCVPGANPVGFGLDSPSTPIQYAPLVPPKLVVRL